MKIIPLIEEIVINENILFKLKEKYVGDGEKQISPNVFKEIENVTNNKFTYLQWLVIRVANHLIKDEDIYKFKEYFDIFEKNKSKFSSNDIHKYKTQDEINTFVETAIKVREKNIKFDDIKDEKDKYVTPNEIEKLESVGIIYLGMNDGYQVFQVPASLKGNQKAYETYKTILGRCAGREQGAKIDICTIGSFNYFNNYFSEHPGSSYFVLFNLSDPLSPYQVHFESNQFKDKNDKEYLP